MTNCLRYSKSETIFTVVQKWSQICCASKHTYRVEPPNVPRKWEKLPYSLSLPKQPIYPYPGYVWWPHPVLLFFIAAFFPSHFGQSFGRAWPQSLLDLLWFLHELAYLTRASPKLTRRLCFPLKLRRRRCHSSKRKRRSCCYCCPMMKIRCLVCSPTTTRSMTSCSLHLLRKRFWMLTRWNPHSGFPTLARRSTSLGDLE